LPFKEIFSVFLILLGFTTGSSAQEHLNICVIRVEFQEDDNDLTTGNGRLMYDTTGVTPNTIDPPPHDRSYFQDQLVAVKNYYLAASKGKFEIKGTVFPLAMQSAYQMPFDMGYYSPNTTEEENDRQLATLFVDAIEAADADPDLRFADFDVVAIFHAGVGKDIDLGFDETPQDIPSLYITPEFLKRSLSPDFEGVEVDGGTIRINRALLLPETESQQDLELALTGIFAANIGSHLGLYDLFSPATQQSGVGAFGLMDSGLFNMFGLSPALPCAFSRKIMNWDSPEDLLYPEPNVTINRFEGVNSQGVTMYRVPINSNEYFLLEYRGERQINIDSVLFVLSEGRENLPTYLEVLRTYLPDRILVSDSTGVLLKIDNYDWGLPGAGILIWHVDESIVNEKGPENRINDDRSNRAVDVEEADGSQDIGFSYSLVEAGFQSELGTWLDFWFTDNPSPLYKNEFSVNSSPNSFSNRNYAPSHITFDNFSDNLNTTMDFTYKRDFFENGFPVNLTEDDKNANTANLYFVNVESVDKPAVIMQNDRGDVYAITDNGKGLFANQNPRILEGKNAGQVFIVFADTNTNGAYDMLFTVTSAGSVAGYRLTDQDYDGSPDSVFFRELNQEVRAQPVVQYPFLYVGTETGKIIRIHFDGLIDETFEAGTALSGFTIIDASRIKTLPSNGDRPYYAPVLIDLDSDGLQDSVYFDTAKKLYMSSSSLNEMIELNDPVTGSPAFADFDQDGVYEIFLTTGHGLYAFKYNGAMVNNFPIFPVLLDKEAITGTPLLLDIDADNYCDVVLTTSAGQIYAFDYKGQMLAGFPFSTGAPIKGSLTAGDIDGDQRTELFAANGRELYAWQFGISESGDLNWWMQATLDPTNNQLVNRLLDKKTSPVPDLLPAAKAYVYPNPNIDNYTNIRYYLNKDASVRIDIFDLAGDLVARFDGPGLGAIDNEIRWQLDGISSGVYICRIEAESGSDQAVQVIKIMVIK